MPAALVTVMSTVPPDSAGAMATIEVAESMRNCVAATLPNETPVTVPRLTPLMVTTSPPLAEPDEMSSPVITGTLPGAV